MSESSQSPWVSVLIVCHNDGKWLPRCLESVRTQTIFERIELIIADNASEDGSDQLARELIADWPNATFLATGGDNGFAVACNRSARMARGNYLYLLNPDTRMEPDCLQRFLETVEPVNAGGAGGTILEYDDDTVQARGSDGFDLFGNPVSPSHAAVPQRLFCIAGFPFIRRDLFFKLGMLDEKFFMYGEEMDLSWRIWISGESLLSAPAAKIHHRGAALVNPAGGSRVVENRTSTQKRFLANRNMLLVVAKNCQCVLLLMLLPCIALLLAECGVTLLMTRRWSLAKSTCLDALVSFWRLRAHVRQQRRQIRALRQRGDFWMLRFFRLRFGRWGEIKKILRLGFPKISRC